MNKKQKILLVNLFSILAVIATLASVVFTRNGDFEAANIFVTICVSAAISALIVQLIYWIAPKFGNKSMRGE